MTLHAPFSVVSGCTLLSRASPLSREERHIDANSGPGSLVADPRRLADFDWRQRYSTGRNDLYADFYEPAISRAATFDRAVGYFRSTIFNLTGAAVARFALRNGRIRLVCSPDIPEEDAKAIDSALSLRTTVETALLRELEQVLDNPEARSGVEMLSALVATDHLDVRLCIWPAGSGLFHDKVGVFHDTVGNALSFVGSANETWQAWSRNGNHESFEVFRSWSSEDDRVDAHAAYFESLWEGREPSLTVIEVPTAVRERLIGVTADSPHAVLKRFAHARAKERRKPFAFQTQAIESWETRDRRGILQHATGTGKTVTALLAIRRWLDSGLPALVLVPSRLLLRQWEREARLELADMDPAILLVGGNNDQWRRHSLLRLFTESSGDPRLTIATIQTACTDDFRRRLHAGPHLLIVADEVHRLGAPGFRKALMANAGGRLGLSATPDRYGDPEGTEEIRSYFGPNLEPVITLRDAIALKRLCPYKYFPHLVSLDDGEIADWQVRTRQIVKAHGVCQARPNDRESSERYRLLLIQRAKIAKQAAEKTGTACAIVEEGYSTPQHWLVYCDDRSQLDEVVSSLRQRRLPVLEYHSAMENDAEATMDRFGRDGGVLVAIKCLDEGVDIPSVSHAVILASSRNPREFIQRRGRVLRRAAGKTSATIHDLLVQPPPSGGANIFDALTEAEVARAVVFARDAANQSAYTGLMTLCARWGVDIESLSELGIESDEDIEDDQGDA